MLRKHYAPQAGPSNQSDYNSSGTCTSGGMVHADSTLWYYRVYGTCRFYSLVLASGCMVYSYSAAEIILCDINKKLYHVIL